MLSNNEAQNGIVAYRYQGVGSSGKRSDSITEFYIPSLEICINRFWVTKSKNPFNVPQEMFRKVGWSIQPLTRVTLSPDLIDEIKQQMNAQGESWNSFNHQLKCVKDTRKNYLAIDESIFKDTLSRWVTKEMNNLTLISDVDDLDNFWDSLKTKGNEVLIELINKYIMTGELLNVIGYRELIKCIAKLDPIEKQSIIDILEEKSAVDNGTIKKFREKDIMEKTGFGLHTSGIVSGGIASAASSVLVESAPVLVVIGFFGLFGGSYVRSKYNDYQLNCLWDEREKRAQSLVEDVKNSESLQKSCKN